MSNSQSTCRGNQKASPTHPSIQPMVVVVVVVVVIVVVVEKRPSEDVRYLSPHNAKRT